MAVALLVMFACYVLQVKHSPYMSMSEMEDVVEDHRKKVATGEDHLHAAIADTIRKRAKPRRHHAAMSAQVSAARRIASNTRQYFFNYNTVEAVLLGCGVIVNLAGIMFESGQCVFRVLSSRLHMLRYITH